MVHLIDKDVLLAKIEKCYNECLKRAKIIDSEYWNTKADAYRNALVILENTLEVKEIDLDAEIMKYLREIYDRDTTIRDVAKHFFEVGIAVNNPTTALDKGMAEEIILALKRVQQDYCISLGKEIEWLQDKFIN